MSTSSPGNMPNCADNRQNPHFLLSHAFHNRLVGLKSQWHKHGAYARSCAKRSRKSALFIKAKALIQERPFYGSTKKGYENRILFRLWLKTQKGNPSAPLPNFDMRF
jgi:hypothetical protein